ncbi:hypothetical protein CAPTEDRAFT_129824 [Capitella teleta]|uniref:Membrane-bound transcription factor site-2 protease n=1 Tax=Capitella teleta TaxID=283909 RepID=R7V2L5_CAPTE|nr:hypothetical protein CAPTEDRAFT_129824 [Capitella teleta]|eukprot:ELU12697.1 hypothetical protein CAPTEDRAFT_129824 [Capitella teleta]
MLQTTVIALFMGFWASLYLLDAFLKTHQGFSRSYINFLSRTGLSVSIAQLRWYTPYFNRLFVRIGSWKTHFLKVWFTCGVCFGLVAMLVSVFLLSLMVYNTLCQKPIEQQILTPVMPGVNLPSNQIGYYLLTLFTCGVLHEAGHAVAAVREQVRVNGFGVFIFILYPGAFVDLYTEHLQVISPLRQLRIYCAGVWHNFVIVVVAIFYLLCLPWFLLPFYSVGSGVIVTSVLENSAVSGPRGLSNGDCITNVGQCRVNHVNDWIRCISSSMVAPSDGYCMALDLIQQQDVSLPSYTTPAGNVECCGNTSNTHLCFFYHSKLSASLNHACLPARTITDRPPCHLQSDCRIPGGDAVCVMPSLDNSTKLLRILHHDKPPLLFLGHPLDLHYSLTLSNYWPKALIIPLDLPYVLETFCKYLISLSGALAILNVVPCYALDGQWILLSFLELSLRSTVPNPETRGLIYTCLLLMGTILLSLNIFIAMWMLFMR